MCNFDCLNCTFSDDCRCDDEPNETEISESLELDKDINWKKRESQARLHETMKFFKYNNSEKGKARLQKYYQSEKGKENERKKAERKRMRRLQKKAGENNEG